MLDYSNSAAGGRRAISPHSRTPACSSCVRCQLRCYARFRTSDLGARPPHAILNIWCALQSVLLHGNAAQAAWRPHCYSISASPQEIRRVFFRLSLSFQDMISPVAHSFCHCSSRASTENHRTPPRDIQTRCSSGSYLPFFSPFLRTSPWAHPALDAKCKMSDARCIRRDAVVLVLHVSDIALSHSHFSPLFPNSSLLFPTLVCPLAWVRSRSR
ncbi:hypothetical protein BKA93DRAFT_359428 [Sparassis latifolia]